MSRSTRARLQSHSQSSLSQQRQQSPRTRRKSAHHEPLDHARYSQQAGSSFASASTATLPERHVVLQACTVGQLTSKADDARVYILGAEFVSDAWRRDEQEGEQGEANKGRKHKLARPPRDIADGPLWYTAPIFLSTTGDLDRHDRHWSPRLPPPRLDALPQLKPLPSDMNPPIGPLLQPWSTELVAQPFLEEPEFEHAWQRADGMGWGEGTQSQEATDSIRWSCDDVTESQVSQVDASGQLVAKDHRDRRIWWSHHMREQEGFHRLWAVIPRPHNLDPLPRPHQTTKRSRLSKPPRPPDFVLPRFFSLPSSSNAHPFHPTIGQHLRSAPTRRVHWIIPIVGPVHIPDWSDHITSPIARKAPIPAAGRWVRELDPASGFSRHVPSSPMGSTTTAPKPRPQALIWTDVLLRHFWTAFLIPLYTDKSFPFGSISVRLSGPKPDPFLNLSAPPPLRPWSAISAVTVPDGSTTLPVRPETGDHVRLYCDARHALSLRTWLNSIEVELSSLLPERSDIPFPSPYLPFEKIRLVLVGPLGEALTVA